MRRESVITYSKTIAGDPILRAGAAAYAAARAPGATVEAIKAAFRG
jgi:hypothetical protein